MLSDTCLFDKDITLTQSHKCVIIDVPNNCSSNKTSKYVRMLQITVMAVGYECLFSMDVVFVVLRPMLVRLILVCLVYMLRCMNVWFVMSDTYVIVCLV